MPTFSAALPSLADQGGAIVIFESLKSGVIAALRQYATKHDMVFRAPHHGVSASGLVSEAQTAQGGMLLLDEADEFAGHALAQLHVHLGAVEQTAPSLRPVIFATIKDYGAPPPPLQRAQPAISALGLPVIVVHPDQTIETVVEGQPLSSPQAQQDLELINRHRASIYQSPLDPEAAGWGPEDLRAEVQRIHRLRNPPGYAW